MLFYIHNRNFNAVIPANTKADAVMALQDYLKGSDDSHVLAQAYTVTEIPDNRIIFRRTNRGIPLPEQFKPVVFLGNGDVYATVMHDHMIDNDQAFYKIDTNAETPRELIGLLIQADGFYPYGQFCMWQMAQKPVWNVPFDYANLPDIADRKLANVYAIANTKEKRIEYKIMTY